MPSNFAKTVHCPTNEALLAFLRDEYHSDAMIEHLAACEFCELTLELLRACPTSPATVAPPAPPVPEPLFRLWPTKPVNK